MRPVFLWPALPGIVIAVFLIVVGPWPTVGSDRRAVEAPLRRALREIEGEVWTIGEGESLLADWAVVPLELPEGTPLAGYGQRRGAPSVGYHDALEVGAVVLGTRDAAGGAAARVAIVASDLLVVTPRIARAVRSRVGLPILFSASHTHSGPGAAMPGLIGRAFGGTYRADVERAIVDAMVSALESAGTGLRPVEAGYAAAGAPDLIRNRARTGTSGYPPTDPHLDLVVLRDENGERLSLVRFSAHPTIVGASNLHFSAGYPGFLRDALAARDGGQVLFLPGAMGSMSPRVAATADPSAADAPAADAPAVAADPEARSLPEAAPDPHGLIRARAYAELLADRVPVATTALETPTLGVVDASPTAPPLQLRVARRLRLSPVLLALNGITPRARITAVRVGPVLFVGLPGDFSGELGAALREWGAGRGAAIVPLSFSGAYLGYISPDAAYGELYDRGSLAYETGIMSWTGPGQERFFVGLAQATASALGFR